MDESEKRLSELESLQLITTMINKAKETYHDTGIATIMWGAVIAVCSLVKLSEIHFGFRLPFDIYWLTFVAVIPQIIITIREKKERKIKSYDDIHLDNLWLAFGISVFLLIVIINVVSSDLNPLLSDYQKLAVAKQPVITFRFFEYISSLFLLLYGFPTFVTGAACGFRPMFWGGIFCWVCCLAALYTNVELDLLLTAASAIAAWLIPGIIMKKEYDKYKKGQLAGNV